MRIVQLIFHLGGGGAERLVVDLSNKLASMGNDVTLVVIRPLNEAKFNFYKGEVHSDVHLLSLGLSEGFSLRKIFAVHRTICGLKPDIVHAHLNVLPYISMLPIIMKDTTFVHTIHNMPKFENPFFLSKLHAEFLYKKYITPVTISKECDSSFHSYYNLNNSILIENGRNIPSKTELFDNVEKQIASYKAPVFIHVARCAPEKNQTMLVKAFNKLAEEGVKFKLLVVGAGYEESGLPDISCDKIIYLGQRQNVGDYLMNADFFCLSSLVEGMPISLIEALACGVTPVCTPAGGVVNMIKDGATGYLSTDFTVDSFVLTLKRALKVPIPKQTLQETYKDNFSMDICATKYLEMYSMNNAYDESNN